MRRPFVVTAIIDAPSCSGRLRLSGPLVTPARPHRPMNAMPTTVTITYGHPREIAVEGAGLGLQDTEDGDQQQDESHRDGQRAGDPEDEEPLQALERLDGLLLEVVDDELDGVATALDHAPAVAIVGSGAEHCHVTSLLVPRPARASRHPSWRGPDCKQPMANRPLGRRSRALAERYVELARATITAASVETVASTKATRDPPATTWASHVSTAPMGTGARS